MLYRQFYAWPDASTMLRIYVTCVHPHLEFECQLWDPNTTKGIQSLELVQKFACEVCLKQWDMNYENMFEQLDLTPLSQCRKLLKLPTMYNIVNDSAYFPTGYFVHMQSFPLLQ